MERYEVISVAGEGSFGRVYKAKLKETNGIVAFKVIQKRGRSEKELESLRQECEIQRHLHHPNIIQMLDSFETDNELVVVSEYADKQLYEILGKAGYLPEPRVQQITCDLVSALFYLHSNRVLHRDLKPQNVLLSSDGTAKLCDFGFARNMSRGTMLLTSIKGTPLYMAPELVTESPYDHNADLWSLGCIVYELLVGMPPFSTTSILHLVRLIRHETIRFPDFVTPACVSFLQGLLQKEPANRLTWPDLLHHPFLQGKVVAAKDQAITIPPFTDSLSESQQKVKETQRQHLTEQLSKQSKLMSNTVKLLDKHEKRQQQQVKEQAASAACSAYNHKHSKLETNEPTNLSDTEFSPDKTPTPLCFNEESSKCSMNVSGRQTKSSDKRRPSLYKHTKKHSRSSDSDDSNQTPVDEGGLGEWSDPNPTQNDEWLDYLQRSMEEVMAGDLSCLLKPPLVAVATAPLARRNASARVIEYVACLLSIPFVVEDVTSDNIATLFETYLESRIVDQIIQGIKILLTDRSTEVLVSVGELRACQLHAVERACLLLSHLVHRQPTQVGSAFTQQLCEALERQGEAEGGGVTLLRHLLGLGKRKARIVADILAVLTQVGRTLPHKMSLVQQVMLGSPPVELLGLVSHSHPLVRARSCVVLRMLASYCGKALLPVWSPCLPERLEALLRDEEEPSVQQAATDAIHELSKLPYYTLQNETSG